VIRASILSLSWIREFRKIFVFLPLVVWFLGCSNSEKPKSSSEPTQIASIPKPTPAPQVQPEEEEDVDYDLMEVDELQALAPQLIGEGKWGRAKQVISLLLEDDTEPLRYHYWSGKTFFESGSYPQAMDEFSYISSSESPKATSFLPEIERYREKGREIAAELALKLHQTKDSKGIAELLFPMLKLAPNMDETEFKSYAPEGTRKKKLVNCKVLAITNIKDSLKEEKTFWSYYQSAFFHKSMKWYADAREAIEKALSLADTQYQIFFALQFQEILESVAPKGRSSDLDKLAALDLNEDMLDEFLQKYSKDLTEKQIQKAREVMKMGMKLKDRLEKSDNDREKLEVLKEFKELSEDILKKEQFPPDIRVKVEKGRKSALKRFEQLQEQIRIKEEALKEI